jgi:hypothetical protein
MRAARAVDEPPTVARTPARFGGVAHRPTFGPGAPAPSEVIGLQRTHGNAFAQRLLREVAATATAIDPAPRVQPATAAAPIPRAVGRDATVRVLPTANSRVGRQPERVWRDWDEEQEREEQRDKDRGDRRSTDGRRNRREVGLPRDPFDDLDSDWAGRKILGHYLNGRGRDANVYDEPAWTEYMTRSDKLHQTVYPVVLGIANEMAGKGRNDTFPAFKRFHAEVENGEGIIGYQYLHGTNRSVGDFTVSGSGTVEHLKGPSQALIPSRNPYVPPKIVQRGPGARVELDLFYQWNDIIDPNFSYSTDIIKWLIAEGISFGRAQSYRILIAWKDKCSVWLPTSGTDLVTGGYPAWT